MTSLSEASRGGAGGRHQLVVLTLVSGSSLPAPASPDAKVTVRAELSGVVLVTDPVPLNSSDPEFGNQQLVWEVSPHQLREFRSRKILLRVELYIDKDIVGHLVLDLRTAQPVKNGEGLPDIKTHKVVGTTISLQLSLALEEAENIDVDITEDDTDTEVQTMTHVDTDTEGELNPTLIEDGSDGEGGYFLVGPKTSASEKFSLSLCLVSAKNLELTLDSNTVYHDQYYWQYNLLGVDISTEQFPSLKLEGEAGSFVSEKATATIKTSRENLLKFLSKSSVSIKLCNGAVVVAAADLALSCLTESSNSSLDPGVTVSRQVDLVSGHNLAVGQDSEGNKPVLGVSLTLTSLEYEVTSGQLSDSDDMEVEAGTHEKIKMTSLEQSRPHSPPTKMSKPDPVDADELVICSPKKPRLSPQVFTPADTPKSSKSLLPQDTTDYLKIKTPTKITPTVSENLGGKPKHFKLSIDLATIKLIKEDLNGQDGVLAYKYQALHKEAIQTDKFLISSGQNIPVPRGYCQFSFCVLRDKMISTFQHHLVQIALYVNSHLLGLSSLNLLEVVKKNSWNGNLNIIEKQSGDIIGQLEVELHLLEDQESPKKVIERKHEELMETKDILNQAARELEVWKTEQKKKFNENLLEIERSHLNMLGQEWKEREVEREQEMQTKMGVMKSLEEELKRELEKIEAERKEMDETRRVLKNDQDVVENDKRSLKTEKLAVVDRLKQQVRERDQQISAKDSEIDQLSKKVKALESESRRSKLTKGGSNERSRRDEETLAELNQLKAEKLSWKTSLELAEAEAARHKAASEELRLEVTSLREQREQMFNKQILELEKRVRELSKPTSEHSDKHSNDAEVQTIKELVYSSGHGEEDEEEQVKTMEGLLRLEEHSAMLLRTGVYTADDEIVIKLNEQIKKLRKKIRAERDK